MKQEELIVLALAGLAAYMVLRTGIAASPAKTAVANTSGLSYTPGAGYGDTSKYAWYAPTAVANGGWGIE